MVVIQVNSDQRKSIVHKLIKLRIKEQDLENRKFYQVSCIKIYPLRIRLKGTVKEK